MNEIVVMNVEKGHYPTEARPCQRSTIRAPCAHSQAAQIYLSQAMIGKL